MEIIWKKEARLSLGKENGDTYTKKVYEGEISEIEILDTYGKAGLYCWDYRVDIKFSRTGFIAMGVPISLFRTYEKRKFVLLEDSSDGECGETFEAKDKEDAMSCILEGMGYRVIEVVENETNTE